MDEEEDLFDSPSRNEGSLTSPVCVDLVETFLDDWKMELMEQNFDLFSPMGRLELDVDDKEAIYEQNRDLLEEPGLLEVEFLPPPATHSTPPAPRGPRPEKGTREFEDIYPKLNHKCCRHECLRHVSPAQAASMRAMVRPRVHMSNDEFRQSLHSHLLAWVCIQYNLRRSGRSRHSLILASGRQDKTLYSSEPLAIRIQIHITSGRLRTAPQDHSFALRRLIVLYCERGPFDINKWYVVINSVHHKCLLFAN